MWLPATLAIALYLQVTLEARYVLGFTAVLAVLPFLISNASPLRRNAALALLLAGSFINLLQHLREPLQLAAHRAPVETAPQWRIAHFLTAQGLRPGDRVAAVNPGNNIRCTWAYGAGLHVVSVIGNDGYSPEDQQQDLNLFWTDPAIQADVLRLFRQEGAVAVIVPAAPQPPVSSAWQSIPDTQAWLLRF